MKRTILVTFLLTLFTSNLRAQNTDGFRESFSVYPKGERPDDIRLGALKDLNGYFPLAAPASLGEWEQRSAEVRRRILVASGLWPMPDRPRVEAVIHGRVDRDQYTVERVYFESHPGFYLTGSLYRPKGKPGPYPVVLSPHGHFTNGRFHDHGREELVHQIKIGAERFEVGGRHPLQARCVQLARMGCMVFHFDMIGYADNQQIGYALAHRHTKPRPELESREAWGLFTAQAEMRLQNVFGLQTFGALRAVDFVVGLPNVDAKRIAVTGASGGGTQTMILAALEPRIAVSFPAVMVSTAMQGGCTCENASALRVGTGNIEFAGLFAPRPQGITYANDWTKEFRQKGLPELKQLYQLYDAEDKIQGDWVVGNNRLDLTYFQHNFNHVSRDKMYDWMNTHLALGFEQPILESDFTPLSKDELTVWNDEHPQPKGGTEFECHFLKQLAAASNAQLQAAARSSDDFRNMVRPALKTLLATSFDEIGEVTRIKVDKAQRDDYWIFHDKIKSDGTELPVVFLHPQNWNGEVVVWVSGKGKSDLLDDGRLRAEARRILQRGYSIVTCDLLQQGEFLSGVNEDDLLQTRRVANNRDFAGYTFGYNQPLIGHRVHDLLTILKFVAGDDHGTKKTHVLATAGAAPVAVLAAAMDGEKIDRLAIDDGDFRFADIKSWRDPDFLPGAIKYGDLPAFLALSNAGQIWVATQDKKSADASMVAYRNLKGKPTFVASQKAVGDAVDWITH